MSEFGTKSDGTMRTIGVDDDGSMKTSNRFSVTKLTADGQVKAGAGVLHSLTFTTDDAAPTAGTIVVYDSLTETGTQIYEENITTTAFKGYSVILDANFSTGLYIGFTTTADVNVIATYR